MRSVTRSQCFAVADVLIAMTVVAILTGTLTVGVLKEQHAAERLAETRAAMRLAEATLLSLQSGQTPPAAPAGMSIHVTPVTGGELPADCAWAMVRIEGRGYSAELTGVVRADGLKGATR